MNYLNQTIACVKRNNRFILLFLGTAILFWMEIICMEKTLLPQILSNPLLEGIPAEDVASELYDKRFVHCLASILSFVVNIAYDVFVLYLGQYYISYLGKQRFGQWLNVALIAELYYLIYRVYLVVVQLLGLDLSVWNIKERFSLLNMLNVSDSGLIADLLGSSMASINVISISFCIILVLLVSRSFKIKFMTSLKYVMSTYGLISIVLMCLLSFVMFINA